MSKTVGPDEYPLYKDGDLVLDPKVIQRLKFVATRVEQLVADAREAGLSDETIIAALLGGVEALREGLS